MNSEGKEVCMMWNFLGSLKEGWFFLSGKKNMSEL